MDSINCSDVPQRRYLYFYVNKKTSLEGKLMVQDNYGVTINQSRLGNYIRLQAKLNATERAGEAEGSIILSGGSMTSFQAKPHCLAVVGVAAQDQLSPKQYAEGCKGVQCDANSYFSNRFGKGTRISSPIGFCKSRFKSQKNRAV